MKKRMMGALGVSALLLAACGSDTDPEQLVVDAAEPWNTGDIEAALDFYSDDVVVTINGFEPAFPSTIHDGKAELQAWFEDLQDGNFQLQVEVVETDGDVVTTETRTWLDETRQLGVAPLVATEVYTVDDGKIQGWTWTLSNESRDDITAALAALAPPPEAAGVMFDGEFCTYDGPEQVAIGTQIEFELLASDGVEGVALIVGRVEPGTTMDDLYEFAASRPASGGEPEFAEPGYKLRFGTGSLVVPLDEAGDYAVSCATAAEGTDRFIPVTMIEVTGV
jgi:ketosteroid isomerase-like protein